MQEMEERIELYDLIFEALTYGGRIVTDGGAPGVFVFSEDTENNRTMTRTAAGNLEDGREVARAALMTSGPGVLRAVLLADGYITVGGVRTDALIAEGYESGDAQSVIVAQAYSRKRRFLRFVANLDGKPVKIGRGNRLLPQV